MSKTIRPIKYKDLNDDSLYSVGEYFNVMIELELFRNRNAVRQWDYKMRQEDEVYSALFFRPFSETGDRKITGANIVKIVNDLRGTK